MRDKTEHMRTVGLVSRCDRPDVLEMARRIIDHLSPKVKVVVDTRTAEALGIRGTHVSKMREAGAEMLISIGGDGTVLRAIQKMDDPLPVLGINMGTIGFLVNVEPADAIDVIDRAVAGFRVEERSRLSIRLNREELPNATNEVVLITAHPAKILSFRIMIDESELEELRADGAVIATSTGSTAYAMSAGGPIVDPRVDATVIVPLAPFRLSARPWVVPAASVIRIELCLPEKDAVVVIDGQYTRSMKEKDVLTITKAAMPARFVALHEDFYAKVRDKLR